MQNHNPSNTIPRDKAIFIDRDGTLNEMVYDETHGLFDSPRRPEQVVLIPGVAEFMVKARKLGYKLIVVTNQPGIAKGTLTVSELEVVNKRLAELLAQEGAFWDSLYYCPHHPKGRPGIASPYVMDCDCRKPKPGLLLRAAAEMNLDLPACWMVGDGLTDVQAAVAAGCRGILITSLKIEQLERLMAIENNTSIIIKSNLAKALAVIELS